MKTVEDLLAANLRLLCERKIAQAHTELRDQQATLDDLSRQEGSAASPDAPPTMAPSLSAPSLAWCRSRRTACR